MSSRILQEDSSLLLTESNDAIINDNFIATDSITTGSPSVSTTGITQDHNSSPANISTTPSVVSTTGITQDHNSSPSVIITSPVVISTADLTQNHSVSATSIQTNVPAVETTTVTQSHSFTVTAIVTGQVAVSTTGLVQVHSFQANDIVTGSPIVPSATATEDENFSVGTILTGNPVVDPTSISQTHNLGAYDIRTGRVVLGTTADPNWIIQQEIGEIQMMFGGWPRRAYEVPDGRLVQAEREIEATFGDRVSVDRKAKSLIKFGKSGELSTTRETVWNVGGNETYVTGNNITHISSSSAADNQTIKLECHTVSGTGVDSKFTFVVQTVTLSGQTPVALDTPVARVSRMFNDGSTDLVGAVYVYENAGATVTAGVPSPASKIHSKIDAGFQQGFKGATTFSNEDYYILTGGFGSISNKQAASVDFFLEVRQAGKVFIEQAAVSANSAGGSWQIELDPAIIIPKNSDIRVTCLSGSQGAVVYCNFKGYLAKVIG